VWGCEELRELGELRKLGDKRELIAIGYKAQEIPPKISFTRLQGKKQWLLPGKLLHFRYNW